MVTVMTVNDNAEDRPDAAPRQLCTAILFADIRGFTALAESEPPVEVLEMLRIYHRCMEEVVRRHGGTPDRCVADTVLATFGIPETGRADATAALACARDLLRTMDGLNLAPAGHPPMRIGAGLHYGPVGVGNLGDAHGMPFTVIGDTVNSASRLERLTRTLGVDLVVSRALVDRVHAEDQRGGDYLVTDLVDAGPQPIRGRISRIPVLTYTEAGRQHAA